MNKSNKTMDIFKNIDVKKSEQNFLNKYKYEKIIKDLKISDDELLQNSSLVKTCVDCYNNCRESKESCPNGGYHYVLYRDENKVLKIKVDECQKYLTKNRFKKIVDNYELRQITTINYDLKEEDFANNISIINDIKNAINTKNSIYIFDDGNNVSDIVSSITNEMADNNKKIAFLNMIELSTYALTISFDKNSNLLELIDILKNVDILVLDEIGNEKFQRFINTNIIYPVLNSRYVNKKPTIFISQFQLKELKKQYELQAFKEKVNIENFIKKINLITNKTEYKFVRR